MLISGTWHLCDDGITRPVVRGEIRASDGSWVEARFLVDTAADHTAFSADVLEALRLPAVTPLEQLSGVGGAAPSVLVDTQVVFPHGADGRVAFRGRYAAFTELEALDICVLGRDLTNLFAVIVDRPQDVVCLLGQRHRYRIVEV
jgi:hypothetical protein